LDCFEEGEKRAERTKPKKKKKGTANGTAAPSETKKRPGDGQLQPQASKKPHLDGTPEVSTGTKRALNQEVRTA